MNREQMRMIQARRQALQMIMQELEEVGMRQFHRSADLQFAQEQSARARVFHSSIILDQLAATVGGPNWRTGMPVQMFAFLFFDLHSTY